MCFSATSSFVAAGGLTIAGIACLKTVKEKQYLRFASTPLFFAIQQAAEGVVWLWQPIQAGNIIGLAAMYTFLFFAITFWPSWIPYMLLPLENNPQRKKALRIIFYWGLILSLFSLYLFISRTITVTNISCNLSYDFKFTHLWQWHLYLAAYFIATIIPLFIINKKLFAFFGLTITIALLASIYISSVAMLSVWCFFAALISGAILFILKQNQKKTL